VERPGGEGAMISDAPNAKPPTVRIPAPPPRDSKRRKGAGGGRGLIWVGALALGVALGVVAYQYVPRVDSTFDYWVALALS